MLWRRCVPDARQARAGERPSSELLPGHPARSIGFTTSAGLLARGSMLRPAFPGEPSGMIERRSPLTVAGAAPDLCPDGRAPDSLLIPLGNRRGEKSMPDAAPQDRMSQAVAGAARRPVFSRSRMAYAACRSQAGKGSSSARRDCVMPVAALPVRQASSMARMAASSIACVPMKTSSWRRSPQVCDQ